MLAFQDHRTGRPVEFIGLRNFTRALQDPVLYLGLRNTLIFWLSTMPAQIIAAFLVATTMLRVLGRRMRGLASGVYYLPVVTSLVAVTLIFQLMYDKNFGILNYFLGFFGVDPISWISNPTMARVSVILLVFWRGVGYYIVLTLAGLMSIDPSLYEYATIEGAGYWKRQWYITLPMMKTIMLFQVFTGTIAGWNIFLEPFLLFGGTSSTSGGAGPGSAGLTVGMFVYMEGIANRRYGYGAAIALMVTVLVTIIALLQFRVMGSKEGSDNA